MSTASSRLACAGLVLADAWTVLVLLPDWRELWRHLRAPHAWIAAVGPDAAAIQLGCAALWCLATWLAVAFVGVACSRIPGRWGRICVRVTDLLLPAVVQRVLAGTVGLGVLLAPVAAGAHPVGPSGAGSGPLPAPSWPLNSRSTPPGGSLPVPTMRPDPSPADPRTDPSRTMPAKPPSSRGSAAVSVRPGDSLWLIAARRLGTGASDQAVAAEWPRWYATNEAAIGDDPDLIHPGQVLRSPQSSPEETS